MHNLSKRGVLGDQIMVISFIAIVIMIGGAVVLGGIIFFGEPFDYKRVSSELLISQISFCVSQNPSVIEDLKKDPLVFYDKFMLNYELVKDNAKIKICEDSLDCSEENGDKVIFQEGSDFVVCGLIGLRSNPSALKCAQKNIYAGGKKYNLLAATKQKLI